MRTNSIPLSRNGRPAARTRPGAWHALPAAPGMSRHQRWIAGIVAKHLHRSSWHGVRGGAMALQYPGRRSLLWLQTIVRQAGHGAGTATRVRMDAPEPPMTRILERQVVQPRIFIQRQQTVKRLQPLFLAARERRLREEPKLRESAPAGLAHHAARLAERSVIDRLTVRTDLLRQVPASLRLPLADGRGSHRREQAGVENEEHSFPERVIRRLRRVEERPIDYAQQAAVKRVAAVSPDDAPAAGGSRRRSSRPQVEGAFDAQSASRGAQQPAAVNVAQITDAVLQQLDRRLAAARERMGRV